MHGTLLLTQMDQHSDGHGATFSPNCENDMTSTIARGHMRRWPENRRPTIRIRTAILSQSRFSTANKINYAPRRGGVVRLSQSGNPVMQRRKCPVLIEIGLRA